MSCVCWQRELRSPTQVFIFPYACVTLVHVKARSKILSESLSLVHLKLMVASESEDYLYF